MNLPPFQVLLDAHADGVHRFLVSRVGPTEADDAFQETFLSALRAYPALRDGRNLQGWLFTIAHRKALDVHRRNGREAVPAAEVPEPGIEDAPPPDATLWRRVDGLPPRERAAVALRFACDLSYAEIAEVDGGTEESARQAVFQGLRKLREELI
ncbi:MAG TPA: sigma-70 family RNA polymerase sigma factor [Solirubrobacteraceae bacterium]